MTQATFQGSPLEHNASGSAPLITLYERDDAIAVPLLSQLRMAGYDVRASRTPVELFDTLSKHLVALVLVDLGAATAGRREFWVALDAQRRGRAIQVMTFRFISQHGDLDLDNEPSARAIADIEAHGVHEFQRIIDGVRQRVPLHGTPGAHGAQGATPINGAGYTANGGIQPLGSALGIAPTPFSAQNGHLFNAPGAAPATAPASWGGIAPLGVSPLVTPFDQGSPGRLPPVQSLPNPGLGAGQFGGYGTYGPMGQMGSMSPTPPQFSAQMETTPFDPSNPPPGVPSFAPPAASPFANPTQSNPFGPGSSPFAQPYEANPFGAQAPTPESLAPPPSFAPPFPAAGSPAPQWPSWNSAPVSGSSGSPSSFPPGAPPSIPPWGSAGRFDASLSSMSSFESSPSYDPISQPPFAAPSIAPSAPVFQDAWAPPDEESEAPTGIVPEIAFQRPALEDAWETPRRPAPIPPALAPSDAWETMRGPVPSPPPAYIPPRSQLVPDPHEAPPSRALMVSTPTETALGGVLVDGALLTPGKLEALKGIQAMLANVSIHRKLGDLALMFKFLSHDQLLAALLVSRGLVSPQQIASLGRVKQEMAASGVENDLETLLVSFHVLPAEQLSKIRAELAN